jgi:hypothetical protein
MNNELNTNLILFAMLLGGIFTSVVWMTCLKWYRRRVIAKAKQQFETRLPFTLEELEAERELAKATHINELKMFELKISEMVRREAEANLKTKTALNRIGKLNDRVERLRLELAAQRKQQKIDKLNRADNLDL